MTTVSTPHSANQSTSRCRSEVKVPKLRTGSGVRCALTAAMCMVVPMSMAAAFGCTMGIVRSTLDFDPLRLISNPPATKAEGLGCARHHSQVRNSSFEQGYMPPKSYRPLPSGPQSSGMRFYPTGSEQRWGQFFRRCAHQGGIAERKTMIDREHDLSITRQAEVLKISRGSVYYLPRRCRSTTSLSCSVSIGCIWSTPSPVRVYSVGCFDRNYVKRSPPCQSLALPPTHRPKSSRHGRAISHGTDAREARSRTTVEGS